MKIQLTGYKYNSKTKASNVYGVVVSDESDVFGHSVFDGYSNKFNASTLEIGEIYEVEFEFIKFKGEYIPKLVGLRKEGE